MYPKMLLPALLSVLLLTACDHKAGSGNTSSDAATMAPAAAATAPADVEWRQHGGDTAETRFSTLQDINSGNVSDLGLDWYFDYPTNRGMEATPLVVDGIIYTTASWSMVFAHDARSGELLWFHDPQVPREWAVHLCCDVVNRGVAHAEGKLISGTLDGRLIALDAASGKLLWETQTTDRSRPYSITGAPRIVKGRAIIGNGGSELGVRGYVSAYDLDSGKLACASTRFPATRKPVSRTRPWRPPPRPGVAVPGGKSVAAARSGTPMAYDPNWTCCTSALAMVLRGIARFAAPMAATICTCPRLWP